MKNQSLLNKKLLAYSKLAAGLMAVPAVSSAQIIYTDISDKKYETQFGVTHFFWDDIDLNNDGRYEVRFAVYEFFNSQPGYYSRGAFMSGLVNQYGKEGMMGKQVQYGSDLFYVASVLEPGDAIGQDAGFINFGKFRSVNFYDGAPDQNIGYWKHVTNGYLGIEFKLNGDLHYGWARFDVQMPANLSSRFRVRFKDYAYNATPNQQIAAGDKGEGPFKIAQTEGTDAGSFHISPNPASDMITIHSDVPFDAGSTVKVFDVTGRVVMQRKISATEPGSNINLDVALFENGLYFVSIQSDNQVLTKKFLISH